MIEFLLTVSLSICIFCLHGILKLRNKVTALGFKLEDRSTLKIGHERSFRLKTNNLLQELSDRIDEEYNDKIMLKDSLEDLKKEKIHEFLRRLYTNGR